jgi:hypothetical protein
MYCLTCEKNCHTNCKEYVYNCYYFYECKWNMSGYDRCVSNNLRKNCYTCGCSYKKHDRDYK